MKNFIMFFYNIDVNNIKKRLNGDYQFDSYILKNIKNIDANLIDIYNMNLYLLNNNILCNKIILNKDNNISSLYNDNIYVLIKPVPNYKKRISFSDIISYDRMINKIDKVTWRELWIKKLDYYGYKISQNNKKNKLLSESFSYFEGITENAIQLLYDSKDVPLYISHRRIGYKSTLYDLCDPFNIIFDTRVRDMADYFKSALFENRETKILKYLNKLNIDETKLLYIRILYPSFYFDLYDQIFLYGGNNKIKEIINMIPKYELFIKELGNYINRYNHIIDIPQWLNRH